jgi:protein phosphatase
MTKITATSNDKAPVGSGRPVFPPVRVDVGALSHRGHVRANNEDHYFVARATRALETMLTNIPAGDVPARADEVNHVMVVADGMGGHAAGEVASRLAISALVGVALDIPDWIFWVDAQHTAEMQRRAREAVQQVESIMVERGRENEDLRGMGSTLTGARCYSRHLLIVHVGDSRAYLLRAGRLERLTKDHTYAQMLVDRGELLPNEVARSGLGHILINVLGGSAEHVEVDVDLLALEHGDRLLLCSDGLTDCVDDETIAAALGAGQPANEVCERLVRLALDGGGRDNITVIVAAFSF